MIQPVGSANPERPAVRIPTLRSKDAAALDPRAFARSTCFAAGHLVAKNAGWRNVRPVIDAGACTGCLQCYMYCPDGTVYKVADEAVAAGRAVVAIDYDFCKGCGICVKACAFGAIALVPEREALAAETAGADAAAAALRDESEEDAR